METSENTELPEQVTFILQLDSEDAQAPDPALVDAVGRDFVDLLRREGNSYRPVYTGARGGFLVDISVFLAPYLANIWAQKDVILADGSALVTILGAAVATKKYLQHALEQRMGKTTTPAPPIKMTLEIEGLPVQIEVPDVQRAEEIIELAQRLSAQQPMAHITRGSKARMKASVPRKPPHKRR